MRLELRPSLHVSQSLSQRLDLRQVISASQLMKMPIVALDVVLENIALSPEMAEGVLSSQDHQTIDGGTKALFSALHPQGDGSSRGGEDSKGGGESGGFVTDGRVKALEGAVMGNVKLEVTPDVIYTGREQNKPLITYGQHLVSKPTLSLVQIPSEFGKAKNLYRALVKYREWVTGKLREGYSEIGDKQREFFWSLDARQLNILTQTSLANILNVSPSTISRIIAGRVVRVDGGKEKGVILRVRDLMPTKNDIGRYYHVAEINVLLEEEAVRGVALSDDDIAQRLDGRIARRTITKFRTRGRVPESYARDREYKDGRTQAYRINLEL